MKNTFTLICSCLTALIIICLLSACNKNEEGKNNSDSSTTSTTSVTTTTTSQEEIVKKDPEVKPVSTVINVNKSFKQKTFTANDGTTLPYRIFIPKDYDESISYPVTLFLHGAGERGNDNTSHLKNVVQKLFNDKSSPFYQCIVVCPQCPANNQWVDTPWANGNYRTSKIPVSNELTAALELLDSLLETYSINPDRQYVMGISMGGFGTWDLIMRNPDRFAAAIPICGGADPLVAQKLINMPIWTFHDSTDPTVPVNGTRDMVSALEEKGAKYVTYTETAKYGHLVWDSVVDTDGLFEWLFAQRKTVD